MSGRQGDTALFQELLRERRRSAFNSVADKFPILSGAISYNRAHETSDVAEDIILKLNKALSESTENKHRPFVILTDELISLLQPLVRQDNSPTSELIAQYNLIIWYTERRHFAQAIALAREWLVSVKIWGDLGIITQVGEYRSAAENKLNSWREKPDSAPNKYQSLTRLWDLLADRRNDFAHFGMRVAEQRSSAKNTRERVMECIALLPAAVRPLGLELESNAHMTTEPEQARGT